MSGSGPRLLTVRATLRVKVEVKRLGDLAPSDRVRDHHPNLPKLSWAHWHLQILSL